MTGERENKQKMIKNTKYDDDDVDDNSKQHKHTHREPIISCD